MHFYLACEIFNSVPHKTTMKSLKYVDSSYCSMFKIAATYFGYPGIRFSSFRNFYFNYI